MAFDWNEYLRVADKIYKQQKQQKQQKRSEFHDEALLRTGISRAYYSAINLAAENAQVRHGHPPFLATDFHGSVITFYKSDMNNPNHQLAGSLLGNLRTNRTKCDYVASSLVSLGDLESAIKLVRDIKSELAKKTY